MEDLDALPADVKGEIIDGELYVQPRPRAGHANVEGGVVDDLRGPFQRGRGGPGGWWILPEPGIELPESPETSPDVAGWRKERLPKLPIDDPIRGVPDWICEVLSPSTRGYDLVTKRRYYARIGVGWLRYVDVEARSISVCRRDGLTWVEIAAHSADEKARMEPFAAVEVDLADWWDMG